METNITPQPHDTSDRSYEAPPGVTGTTINIWWTADTPLETDEVEGIILAMRDAAEATYQAIKDSREDTELADALTSGEAEFVRVDHPIAVRRIVPGLED